MTFRYLAPEYFMHGIVDEKTDIFAFGVLLLELITGRRAVDTASRQSLVMWVWFHSNLTSFKPILIWTVDTWRDYNIITCDVGIFSFWGIVFSSDYLNLIIENSAPKIHGNYLELVQKKN